MEDRLDRLHARARAHPVFQRLAVVTRILLALGFIPTSLVKIMGRPFTTLGLDTSVGYFFDALHRTGAWWQFIGWAQLTAAVLILIPATSTLGAVIFFPIILNIFVITVAVGFTGTPFITGPMLVAGLFLLCWDWDRLKLLFFPPARRPAVVRWRPTRLEMAGYVLGGLAGLVVMSAVRGLMPRAVTLPALATGAVAALLVLAGWMQAARSPGAVRASR
ncbi:MAG: DoxX family protein [Gemmatimonadetes bacterium]|nr:DoxX family protein [Gemmatimonadota bacterium]